MDIALDPSLGGFDFSSTPGRQTADQLSGLRKFSKIGEAVAKHRLTQAKDALNVLKKVSDGDSAAMAVAERQLVHAEHLARVAKNTGRFLGALGTLANVRNRIDASANNGKFARIVDGVLGATVISGAKQVALLDAVDTISRGEISKLTGGSVSAVMVLGESMATKNDRSAAAFHQRSLAGEFGIVLKQASRAGDFYAREGVSHVLGDLLRQIRNVF